MFDQLKEVEERFESLNQKLSDPELVSNQTQYQKVVKEHSGLKELVETYRNYCKSRQELEDNRELLEEKDQEIQEMAKEEIPRLETEIKQLEEHLQILLLPKDPDDDKNVLLEIRGGAGGDEAALFSGDLLRMYLRYAEKKNWKVEMMSSSPTPGSGFKEVIILISGDQVFSELKYESGVHRVQRVPQTETQGRIHTSTATVAVLPEAEDVDVQIETKDLQIDVFRASGPGGQSVNTTDSAVRITHIPSGTVVICQDEKSQHKNKAKALKVLKTRILEVERAKAEKEASDERRSMVGSGDRSEKIRTYNFPQSRITDHRVGLTTHQLEYILDGKLESLIEPIRTHFQTEALKAGGA